MSLIDNMCTCQLPPLSAMCEVCVTSNSFYNAIVTGDTYTVRLLLETKDIDPRAYEDAAVQASYMNNDDEMMALLREYGCTV